MGTEPLNSDSIWCPGPRSLTAVCGSARAATLVADLAHYRAIGRRLRARLSDSPAVFDQLLLEPVSEFALERLAEALETSKMELNRVEAQIPGFRTDLAWLLKLGFDPEVRVDPDLRPGVQRERAWEVADRMAARIVPNRFSLLVSDDPTPLELLSPYASDLIGPLHRWAIENSERITVPGLVDRIQDGGKDAARDLACLVVRDLFRHEPALLEERRANEQTQGLFLWDSGGATFGVAEIDRLAAPDPALPREGAPTLAVLAGGGPVFLAAAAGRLLETGRVDRTAVVHGVDVDSDRVIVPRAVLTPEDGVRLPESQAVGEAASKLGVDVAWVEPLEIAGPTAFASPLALLLGVHRRAWAADQLDPDAPCFVVLYGEGQTYRRIHIERAQTQLNAGRLALLSLLDPGLTGSTAQSGSAHPKRLPRTRYRA